MRFALRNSAKLGVKRPQLTRIKISHPFRWRDAAPNRNALLDSGVSFCPECGNSLPKIGMKTPAKEKRRKNKTAKPKARPKKPKKSSRLLRTAMTAITTTATSMFVVIVLLSRFVLFAGYVPTESMEPAIHKDSYILGCRIFGELKVRAKMSTSSS
ncbi:S26 family signal peptidase [Acutalibacter sp. 1XD8-33]|nr:S26 family signal peptidase [Acutalibacter sp. 1XD8-33]